MRTTWAFDDDVREAARALARQQGIPFGVVISGLARESLRSIHSVKTSRKKCPALPFLPIQSSGGVLDLELVNPLNDEVL